VEEYEDDHRGRSPIMEIMNEPTERYLQAQISDTDIGVINGRHIIKELADARDGLEDENKKDRGPEAVLDGRTSRDLFGQKNAN
jgi:hypothetical protein